MQYPPHPLLSHQQRSWNLLREVLPEGWQGQARETGAVRRMFKKFKGVEALMRGFLMHLMGNLSLKETAMLMKQQGLGEVSHVALQYRLETASNWFAWITEQLAAQGGVALPSLNRVVRVVDGTTIKEPGAKGEQWRVHYSLDLASLRCLQCDVTQRETGETLRRMEVEPGEVVMADRYYANTAAVFSVLARQADVLVRMRTRGMRLFNAEQQPLDLLSEMRSLQAEGAVAECEAFLHSQDGQIHPGRLVMMKKNAIATSKSQKDKLTHAKQNHEEVISETAWEAAGYVLIWTSLPKDVLDARLILELYRRRWQIELAFKREKTLLAMRDIPKHKPETARAWIQGKLMLAMLLETLSAKAEAFPPAQLAV